MRSKKILEKRFIKMEGVFEKLEMIREDEAIAVKFVGNKIRM